ncbi:MAG: hypothetical protein EWV55_10295 [Microcystis viridis Mv_BB_P_19951000_S69]|uniref:Uncharacterized protein n=1 Tax=Microcystis viridis Mv_BB_P_19951000_S68D TaxID=2486270 RepID=A0A552H6X7_MICVR|nr:MAG: hypothetical protein EWV77_23640 [Microcystis viridis Mv_BB_P_19951000_S68D]TRU72925.1 MAG: hypothetical protein EWV47_14180 [Microcystis viridis Mv_BB_P_19951000_S68]TRU74764.1 MAG: hypothetical protein EWV55_10295 [Microcystis viridis Mv_BB_P_19951000_S69]TRU82429.1 MAG: hypothetical protein EWV46_18765 [Microcystis viridis Mv_BB_P_19951000_S69D]
MVQAVNYQNQLSCTEFKLRIVNFSTNAQTFSPCSQLRHSGAVLTSNLDSQQLIPSKLTLSTIEIESFPTN